MVGASVDQTAIPGDWQTAREQTVEMTDQFGYCFTQFQPDCPVRSLTSPTRFRSLWK